MLLFSRTGKRIFGLFPKVVRKISAGGVEMQISEDAVDEIREYLRDLFDELVARAKDEYQRMASVQQISTHLSRVMDDALPRVLQAHHIPALPDNVRGTIHVPDIVFSSYLYQLVNYYPTDSRPGGVPTAVSRSDLASLDVAGDLANRWDAETRLWQGRMRYAN